MKRACTNLITVVAILIALPVTCLGQATGDKVKIIINLLTNPNVGQFSIPESHVLPESFWTTETFITNRLSNLYFADVDPSKSAKRVSDELWAILNSDTDAEEKKMKIRELIYPPSPDTSLDADKTTLYGMIKNDTKDPDGAEVWTRLVQFWFLKVSNDSRFLKALEEIVEVIPQLADAMIKVHAAAEPSAPRQSSSDTATALKFVESANQSTRELELRKIEATENDRQIAMYLGIAVLGFSTVIFVLLLVMMRLQKVKWGGLSFKLAAIAIVIHAGLFLTVTGLSEDHMSPMFGLLGAVAGYILGQSNAS